MGLLSEVVISGSLDLAAKGSSPFISLEQRWNQYTEHTETQLLEFGAELCEFVQSLDPGLWDLRPQTIAYNPKMRSMDLGVQTPTRPSALAGDDFAVSFLSETTITKETQTEKDVCW